MNYDCDIQKARPDLKCENRVGSTERPPELLLDGRIVLLCPGCLKKFEPRQPPYPWWSFYSLEGSDPERRPLGTDPPPRCAREWIDDEAWSELEDKHFSKGGECLNGLAQAGLFARQDYLWEGQSKKDSELIKSSRGPSRRTLEVDALHEGNGVLIEIEGGASHKKYAVERNVIRAALHTDIRYLFVGVPRSYETAQPEGKDGHRINRPFREAQDLLDDICASHRLRLGLQGVLLFGY